MTTRAGVIAFQETVVHMEEGTSENEDICRNASRSFWCEGIPANRMDKTAILIVVGLYVTGNVELHVVFDPYSEAEYS